MGFTYDANDRLLTETADGAQTAYAYDANGNTISKGSPGTLTEYAYDDANRLIEARTPDGTTRYVYNADGLRVRSTHTPTGGTATTTWYLQDSGYAYAQVIEQHVGDSVAQKRLTATYTFADELVSQTRYDEQGAPTTAFVQMDGFGSTRWVTDQSGNITDSIDYDAFGNEIARTGTTEVEHRYRGEAFDDELGLYYLRARWMDPSVGRFTQMDEWEGKSCAPLTLNKFFYADANPVLGLDPSGRMTIIEQMQTLGQQMGARIRAGTSNYNTVRRMSAKACSLAQPLVFPFNELSGKILKGTGFEAHHVLKNADMEKLGLNYRRMTALAIPLFGGTRIPGSPHSVASIFQSQNKLNNPTFNQILAQAYNGLLAAGCKKRDATEIVDFVRNAVRLENLGVPL